MTHSDLFRNNVTISARRRRIRRRLRLAVSTRPVLYAIYARAEKLRFQITRETTVVVDSFPRSANSFFEAAFERAHGGREVVAHHSHAAGQVLAGVRRGLPCVVLLREPEAAIASFYEMNGGDYPVDLCTLEYAVFYEALLPVADRLVVVETETLEERFHALMVHLQACWGLRVEPYEIVPETRAEIMRAVDETGHARNGFAAERYSDSRPEAERAKRAAVLASIRTTIEAPQNSKVLKRARTAHAALQARAFGLSREDIE